MERRRNQPGQARRVRASRRRRISHRKQNKAGMLCVSCIVLFLLLIMSTQIFRLYQQNEGLKAEEAQKTAELEGEQERQEEIQAYEEYVATPEYIEQIAKTKLGLVYSNEIVFKEQKSQE